MTTTQAQDREQAAWWAWRDRLATRTWDDRDCWQQGHRAWDHEAGPRGWASSRSEWARQTGEAREHRAQVTENDFQPKGGLPVLLAARADDINVTDLADALRWTRKEGK